MSRFNSRALIGATMIFVVAAVTVTIDGSMVRAAQPPVDLQTAAPFAILSGTPNITDAGNASVINGNVGLSPATGAGIGLLCSQVTGTIYSVDASGPLPCRITDGPLMVMAKNHLTAAYTDVAGRTPLTTVPTELGGTTKIPGVYDSSSTTFGITAGAGPLVLDGQGDPTSVFIFEAPFSGTGLTIGAGSVVSLINGAQACNVFWRVDTASIGTTADFIGTILALNSITVANGADIQGRLLARNGNVTLINDTISVSNCAATTSTDEDAEGSGGVAGSSSVIPGLPNTGIFSGTSLLWAAIPAVVIVAISAVVYLRRKRRS